MRRTIEHVSKCLEAAGYVADAALATTLSMLLTLQRPLLVEGDAGVGKTELAKAMAKGFDARLIRLQCYEGLDTATAVYEWNYPHQLLAIKLQEAAGSGNADETDIFSERFLLARPLLEAIREPSPAVLLIDEIDRADEAFEAYLLEVLSDFQISIPELGTIRARSIPRVVLTSNGTRELSDALRRRCLYHYLDYPDLAKELAIVHRHLPGIDGQLARQVVTFVQALRTKPVRKRPGIAETLDWASALTGLEVRTLVENPVLVDETLACLLKTEEDMKAYRGGEARALLSAIA
jgi:MoxR-like ATPase